jgi:peroxiredoxin
LEPSALVALLALAATAVAATPARAGKFNEVLSIGDAAPDWADLEGVDGRRHALADFAEARALVLVFTCNHCPVARAYESRVVALADAWRDRGVQVIAISSSRQEADSLEEMKVRAAEAGYSFPYLEGNSLAVARAYGPIATPTFFVLDAERRIAYMGRFDDQTDATRVRRRYVADAVEAVLAGREPEVTETRPEGCPIELPE